ncbi:hypothetical protein [Pseudoduganella chitinolytica]|uniref:DUF3616 domain-containing protein n=1 Tax=Pseudoduganella chitinolytica TaxID=34070 RepID=A0ABY8B4M9_9BURK|nr:hypothetical protein [Pseudoduganella chitinolytica]WEF30830.1 hypothetical protein PX653_15250 [Pseudoduganella chitinolytica]
MKYLSTAIGAALLTAGVASFARGAPVVLTKPGATFVQQMQMGPDGLLCIVGHVIDPDGDLQPRGTAILFNTKTNKVLWQQTVDAPDDSAANRFVACRSDGKTTYVGANVDTHSQRSLAQSLAYVYQFDEKGKITARKELVTGASNSFVYDLDVDGKAVSVIGKANDTKADRDVNGIFFASLDRGLKKATFTQLPTGAFRNDAVVRLAGNTALLGGSFSPAAVPKDDVPQDYAVSRIVGGKYQFSVRPQKARPRDVATTITAAHEIVSLGAPGKTTTLTVVGADGKIRDTREVRSQFCMTSAMSGNDNSLYAIRSSCARSQDTPKLVQIDRKTGIETVVTGISGEPVKVLVVGDVALVVTEKSDGSLQLQVVGKGA